MWLFFVFRVRLREYFRLFIVLAADHEKITKQNKRASCKKNKKTRQRHPHAKRIKNKRARLVKFCNSKSIALQ